MGKLIDGKWETQPELFNTKKTDGHFVREDSSWRNDISPDGEFPPEPNRYHLYVSYACPWASRALAVRALKGLEDVISVDAVHYLMGEDGWVFDPDNTGATEDSVNGFSYLRDVYTKDTPDASTRVTVPVLWDKKEGKIVNNESSEIIRILNNQFNEWAKNPELDLYPEDLRTDIDAINEWVYHDINNGVYKCGFASTQEAYDQAVNTLFDSLDRMEDILEHNRYLTGERLTEADIRAFVTLIRFDPVYVTHFKTNKKRIADYPNISNYVREIFQLPGIEDTVNMYHIRHHYYESHRGINTHGIVPPGFEFDGSAPFDRHGLVENTPGLAAARIRLLSTELTGGGGDDGGVEGAEPTAA